MSLRETQEVRLVGHSIAYKMNWSHNVSVEAFLRGMVIGSSLNVCCGQSYVGDVRVDKDEHTTRTEAGNLFDLKFPPLSFDTVICDPPFRFYNRFDWVKRLSYLARKRLLLSSLLQSIKLSRKVWTKSLYGIETTGKPMIRFYQCFDRVGQTIEGQEFDE